MPGLIDENLTPIIAQFLRECGQDAVHVRDGNGPGIGTLDVDLFKWLAARPEPDWFFITQDFSQSKRISEINSMRSHHVRACFLRSKKGLSRWEMAREIIRMWDNLKNHTIRNPGHWIVQISPASNTLRPYK